LARQGLHVDGLEPQRFLSAGGWGQKADREQRAQAGDKAEPPGNVLAADEC
jgi:hypothetical protein